MKSDRGVTRRDFVRGALSTGVALSGLTILRAARGGEAAKSFKAGLVGCGGRGIGAMINHLEAAKFLNIDVKITALADVLKERIEQARERLKQDNLSVPDAACFTGFDAYRKLIDSGVEIVLLATPPVFRPLHLEVAVAAGKHVFMEKPVAVDPVGALRIIAAGETAKPKNLAIVAGTQRRHQQQYLASRKLVEEGAMGRILGGSIYWCGGQQWARKREAGWSDADYMLYNWNNFVEMSGDCIVEQHMHNIDVAVWFMGATPTLAVGFGGRARRKTGNQYDFFTVDFTFPGEIHISSMSRQINGTWSREGEHLVGEKGIFLGTGGIRLHTKQKLELPEIPGHENAYVQEHVDLLDGIIKGKPLNEAKTVAESTLAGIMGRISAYTGQPVRWGDVSKPEGTFGKLQLSPTAEDFEKGTVKAPPDDVVPIPGKE